MRILKWLFGVDAIETNGAYQYRLEKKRTDTGEGVIVVRVPNGQRLQWQTLPVSDGLESLNIVGESHRPKELNDSSFAPGNSLKLIREPNNQFDSNAVGVWNKQMTLQAGYLSKGDAERFACRIDSGESLSCISMWEERRRGKRVSLRILILDSRARVDTSQANRFLD